ncbi:MAG: glucose-1-phosphate adenylyltransferase, partial [Clostridia bacterium]|nr:glucose-1-phosphate adenylyltransferase [Clostridia bacterium]
ENSLVSGGCEIDGNIDYSVLFENVTVEEGATVEYSLAMPGAVIKKGAKVRYAIIAENVVVEENATVGCSPEDCGDAADWGIAVVGDNLTVGKNATVVAGKMIKEDVKEGENI